MKIVFTTDGLVRGGKERQLSMLFANLNENYDKIIVTSNFDKDNNYLSEYGIQNANIYIYTGLKDYYKIIKEFSPDVIFSWDFRGSLFTLIIRLVTNFTFINGSIRHGVRAKKLKHYIRSIIAWMSPYIIANSFAGLKANNLSKRKNTFVLYNGFDKKFLISDPNCNKNKLIKKYYQNQI